MRFDSSPGDQVSGFGEMDIITGFEPVGRGSIPLGPAKFYFFKENSMKRAKR